MRKKREGHCDFDTVHRKLFSISQADLLACVWDQMDSTGFIEDGNEDDVKIVEGQFNMVKESKVCEKAKPFYAESVKTEFKGGENENDGESNFEKWFILITQCMEVGGVEAGEQMFKKEGGF